MTQPPLPPRPKAATAFMVVPIVFIGAMGLAVAALWVLSRTTPDATGARVQVVFQSSCLAETKPLIDARAAQIGLGTPQWTGTDTMEFTLPDLPGADQAIPALLAQRGQLVVSDEAGRTTFETNAIESIAIDLDNAGMPQTLLKLGPDGLAALSSSTGEQFTPTLDAVPLATQTRSAIEADGVLTLESGSGKTADRMRRAADRAIVLEHGPLPCETTVGSVNTIP